MDKKDIISDKTKRYYKNDKDVILNILQALTREFMRKLPENNPLIEDKKQKMKEYQQEYYINNKKLLKGRAKNKYKSLTEDEKQKTKDYQKQYRENNPLTEDKKQKMREYQKQYRENMTDEQKQKMKDYQKK